MIAFTTFSEDELRRSSERLISDAFAHERQQYASDAFSRHASDVNPYFNPRADYDNHRDHRFIRQPFGLPSMGASADYHFKSQYDYYDIVEIARARDRNDSIVSQVIWRLVTNVVQKGFTLQVDTGDEGLDRELFARWTEWSHDPDQVDIAGEWCWHEYEQMAYRACLVDGDCLVVCTERGLQLIEAHNVGLPTSQAEKHNVFLGVQLNKDRKRIAYYVTQDPIHEVRRTNMKTKARRIETRNEDGIRQVCHLYDTTRASLTRGVTAMYPILIPLGMVEDINLAKLLQQQVTSCVTFISEFDSDAPSADLPMTDYGNTFTRTGYNGNEVIEDMEPGLRIKGQPGEKIKGFSPSIPNAEFFEHMRQQQAIIGANLDLTVAQVCLDFEKENFVGYRGALHEARKGIQRRQTLLMHRLHTPIYRHKVYEWMQEDPSLARRRKKIRPYGHRWHPPAFEYLEPINDAKGDLIRVANNLTSKRRVAAERGVDLETINQEQVEDNGKLLIAAIEKANEINQMYPDLPAPVTHRDVIQMPTAEGNQISAQRDLSQDDGDTKPGGKQP